VVPDGRQVEVEEYEQIVERVAAIDVAKASGMVCTRMPHPTIPGKRITRVWEVAARTNAIIALADQLTRQGIERVVVESTSGSGRRADAARAGRPSARSGRGRGSSDRRPQGFAGLGDPLALADQVGGVLVGEPGP
jgi:hypothetical protein